jgi:hypothetical protein
VWIGCEARETYQSASFTQHSHVSRETKSRHTTLSSIVSTWQITAHPLGGLKKTKKTTQTIVQTLEL